MIAYGYGKCSSKDAIFDPTDPSWDPSTLALDKVKYQPVSAGLDTRSGTVTWPKMQFLMCCCGPTKLRMVVVATQLFWMFTPKIGEDEPILTSIVFKWGLVQPHQWGW